MSISGFKNPFPSFGAIPGDTIERSDANPHFLRDLSPAHGVAFWIRQSQNRPIAFLLT